MRNQTSIKTFHNTQSVLSELQEVLPSPDNPVLVNGFLSMTAIMSDYLLSQRSNSNEPVSYKALAASMDLDNLIKVKNRSESSSKLARCIEEYIACLSLPPWEEASKSGTPNTVWMNHNFSYGHLLAFAKND